MYANRVHPKIYFCILEWGEGAEKKNTFQNNYQHLYTFCTIIIVMKAVAMVGLALLLLGSRIVCGVGTVYGALREILSERGTIYFFKLLFPTVLYPTVVLMCCPLSGALN